MITKYAPSLAGSFPVAKSPVGGRDLELLTIARVEYSIWI